MPEEDRRLTRGAYVEGPLYLEVRRLILADLSEGTWRAGDRLPIESDLAKRFGISISTVRKAVDALVTERILVRQAGRGTFVASHSDDHAFELFFHFVDEKGRRTEVDNRMRSFAIEPADPEVQRQLRLPGGERVARIANLRHSQGVPLMVDRLWVPLSVFPGLTAESFAGRPKSIYGFYQERFGVTVIRVEESLTAVPADDETAGCLDLPAGAPLLRVVRVAFSYEDRPVEYRQRFVNTDHHAYRNSIGLRF